MPFKIKKVCLTSTLFFTVVVLTILVLFHFFSNGKTIQKPGDMAKSNLIIGGNECKKTSEVIVISKKQKAAIEYSDDSGWNTITSFPAPNDWQGVFRKNRKVTLKPFSMGQYPVTQELFSKVMGFNPCHFKKENLGIKYNYSCPDENPDLRAADTISWFDAVVFCNRLTIQQMKKSDCIYYSDSTCKKIYTKEDGDKKIIPIKGKNKKGYRLPTEAEWEYAARGGNPSGENWNYPFSGTQSKNRKPVYDSGVCMFTDENLNAYGWYKGNSYGVTHEVGTKLPNSLNLYDMSGNVWEWLQDWYEYDISDGEVISPQGAKEGTDRVLRGGSWYDEAYASCVTRRFHNSHPYIPHYYFGFRYCRSL